MKSLYRICVVLSTVLVLGTSQKDYQPRYQERRNQRIFNEDPQFNSPPKDDYPANSYANHHQKPHHQPKAQSYPKYDDTSYQHAPSYPANTRHYAPPSRNVNSPNYPSNNGRARRIGKISIPMGESSHQVFHIPANADMSNMKIIQVDTNFDDSDVPQAVKEVFARVLAANRLKQARDGKTQSNVDKNARKPANRNKSNKNPNANPAKQNYPVRQGYRRPWNNPKSSRNTPIYKELPVVEPTLAPIGHKPEYAYDEAPISQTATIKPDDAVIPHVSITAPTDENNYPVITVNGINPTLVPVYEPSTNPILYDNIPNTPQEPAPVILPGDVKIPDPTEKYLSDTIIPVTDNVPTSSNPLSTGDSNLQLNPDNKHSNPLIPVDTQTTLKPVPTADKRPVPDNIHTDKTDTPLNDQPSDKAQGTTEEPSFLTTLLNLFQRQTDLDDDKTHGPNVATDNVSNAIGKHAPENEDDDSDDLDDDDSEQSSEETKDTSPEKVKHEETKDTSPEKVKHEENKDTSPEKVKREKTKDTSPEKVKHEENKEVPNNKNGKNTKQAAADKEAERNKPSETQATTPNNVDILGDSEELTGEDAVPEPLSPISLIIDLIKNALLGSQVKKLEEPNVKVAKEVRSTQ